MPKKDGDSGMDMKTIILIVTLLGGTNALQAAGITAPAVNAKAEVTANSDFMRDELNQCLKELKECYRNCSRQNTLMRSAPPLAPLLLAEDTVLLKDGVVEKYSGGGGWSSKSIADSELSSEWESKVPFPEQLIP
jgi:hypothetical protein